MDDQNALAVRQGVEGQIDRIEVFALACDVPNGPVSSLALMPVRNGLLVRITMDSGLVGWGEAWCNYPPKGNLAKLALFDGPIGESLLGLRVDEWTMLRTRLERKWARMIVHTGEPGPFNHCLSAIDMAAADLAAKTANVPLSRLLSADPASDAAVYASSPRVEDPDDLAARLIELGHTGVKLKVGFDAAGDKRLLERFRAGDNAGLMLGVDANQNWTRQEAARVIDLLSAHDLAFVEEPIFALDPLKDWAQVASDSPVPIAAGENITSARQFADMVEQGGLGVAQPDVAKWGGISGAMEVGRDALNQGAQVMLHYMGTALGLAASLHVMSALKCDGRVELDANPNPLRTDLGDMELRPTAGRLPAPDRPGIGFEPDPEALRRFCVAETTVTRN